MAALERPNRTPENDEGLLARLGNINQDENPIERARRLDTFFEEIEELSAQEGDPQEVDEQGTLPSSRT